MPSRLPEQVTVSPDQAAAFILHHQGLHTNSQPSGIEGIAQVFERLRVIQYDPLSPCGNNVDLVLQSRVSNIHIGQYYDWLYGQRQGIEYYDKVLCILPVQDLSYTAFKRQQLLQRSQIKTFLYQHQAELRQLVDQIGKTGPLSAADIADSRSVEWSWNTASWGRAALESLWESGQLVISHRAGGRKFYQLPQRIYENFTLDGPVDIGKAHILRRLQAVGLLPLSGASTGWLGLTPASQKASAIKAALQDGQVSIVNISGVKAQYIVESKNIDLLVNPPQAQAKMSFIAPLDTLMWDRRMVSQFFNFDYKWEVYTPASQRKFGYYVLPILYGSQLIGRIEPTLRHGKLVIHNRWLEPNVTWTKSIDRAYNAAIQKFASYARAKDIEDIPAA